MRAARAVATRVTSVGAAVALAAAGLIGAVGIVATADPAGANTTNLGTTSCALSTGTQAISATVDSTISPSPVNAGNTFNVTGLALHSTLIANATTSVAAGQTLTVTFAATMSATNATPGAQTATFSGQVTLPNPFPIGDSAPITLNGSVGGFTASSSGATSSQVSLDPSGKLTATLGTANIVGECTGPPPVQINSVQIVPAAGFVQTVLPSAGPITGGTTVKVVGSHFAGVTAVKFGTTNATSFQLVSPNVIEAVVPATTIDGNTQQVEDITVTTAAGPSKVQPHDQFTYVDTSLGAIVDGVTPSIGTSAGGTTVEISGAGFAGGDGSNGCNLTNAVTSVNVGSTVLDPSNYTVNSDSSITATVPAGSGIQNVTVVGCDESTPSPISPSDQYNYNPGYILAASDGGIFSYGQVPGHAGFFGSAGNLPLNKPVVGIARTPNGNGYWLAAADGGIFNYGGAVFYGSAGNLVLNKPVVGVASTPDGAGYWEVASDGGIFTYGDAGFYGSAGNLVLAAPIVGMAATPDGKGYWLVGSDGGVFAYGDASFQGSLSGTTLASPVVGIAATADNGGYWLLTSDGAVFNKGDAGFYGDMAGFTLNGTMVGMTGVQAPVLPV